MLGRHEQAAVWLHVWADLGRAPRTMDVYARELAEYLEMCGAGGGSSRSALIGPISQAMSRNWLTDPAAEARLGRWSRGRTRTGRGPRAEAGRCRCRRR